MKNRQLRKILTEMLNDADSPLLCIPASKEGNEVKAKITQSMKDDCVGRFHYYEDAHQHTGQSPHDAPAHDKENALASVKRTVPWEVCEEIYSQMCAIAQADAKEALKG